MDTWFDIWKYPIGFPIPQLHTMGMGDSGKADEECDPLCQNGDIVKLPLLGKIWGWGASLVQLHLGTMKWDPELPNDITVFGG